MKGQLKNLKGMRKYQQWMTKLEGKSSIKNSIYTGPQSNASKLINIKRQKSKCVWLGLSEHACDS